MGQSHYAAWCRSDIRTELGTLTRSITQAAQAAPGAVSANLIFSYLDISPLSSGGSYMNLTTTPSDWFAFALNDSGGGDDNHDDFVGFANIVIDRGGLCSSKYRDSDPGRAATVRNRSGWRYCCGPMAQAPQEEGGCVN